MARNDRSLANLTWLLLAWLTAPTATSLVFEVDRVDDVALPIGCDPAVVLDCSLRTAITLANANPGPDEILMPSGTYTLTLVGDDDLNQVGDLNILDDLVILGVPENRPLITASTLSDDSLLWVAQAVSFEMYDVDVHRQDDGKRILSAFSASSVKLEAVRMETMDSTGGAIFLSGTGDLTEVEILSHDGRAMWAGGITVIERSDFIGNIISLGPFTFKNSKITWDPSVSGIGTPIDALRFINSGDRLIEASRIEGAGQPFTPTRGIYLGAASDLVIRDTVIRNFALDADGGSGLEVAFANSVTIEDCFFEQNTTAGSKGGAVWLHTEVDPYVATVTGTTFANNETDSAVGEGGAIHLDEDLELILRNSTFVGNSARFGGALWTAAGSHATLENVTLSDQVASVGSAILNSGTVDLQASLIDGECAGAGVRSSLGSNLESPGNSCDLSRASDRPNSADPMLAPLADNGGSTPTLMPLAGSPARDFATCELDEDQRGAPRPFDGGGGLLCDAGAVEADSPPPDWIFADGFESGDTASWSQTLP